MRQHRSYGGRFRQELFFPKGEIDSMCEAELRKAGYFPESPAPINIERFVETHYARIEYVDLPEGILGCTEFEKTGKVVRVIIAASLDSGQKHEVRRLRSTIAHEAGHCMLHASLFISDRFQTSFQKPDKPSAGEMKIMCRDADIQEADNRPISEQKRGYDGRWWEYQANQAIGGFLLPKKLVGKVVAPFVKATSLGTAGVFDESRRKGAIRLLAETFNVNPKVAEIRLGNMYVVDDQQLTL